VLKLKDDCQVIKPTVLLSVPRLYNKIVEAVKTKFAAETGVKRWLIDKAVASKLENIRESGDY
jgi:long-chain acyl-CoA synthetase